MAIACPHCRHRLRLKSTRPGSFRPRCPGCGEPFLLIVPAGDGGQVQVRRLAGDTVPTQPARRGVRPPATEAAPAGSSLPVLVLAENPTPPPRDHLSPAFSPPGDDGDAPAVPAEVRGYAIERELGRGGMGSVYLARQLSLDRHVALKVMSKKWATDPVFVARFTREAYAAAQLSHPNIVQIYDIGEADGARYFSMEYVRGRSLADVVRAQGKLDPETAVGYVLQAARGLKHAHDRGMTHRDVKPDNLLLDEQGLVKVADLGLVKTSVSTRADDTLSDIALTGLDSLPANMTGTRIALGTPAYMSPEQCRDAATVDHRADVYSLGCTLYVLVTGRPPFDGTTAVELMSRHAYEQLVPPERIVSRVPKELSAVIQRMMEKDPEARYQSMAEVVRTLEAWLGVHHTGTFTPPEEEIAKLEEYALRFHAAPTALLRGRLIEGFLGAAALAAVLIAFFGRLGWAFGILGLVAQASLAYFVVDGATRRGHLFRRTNQFLWGLSWGDWAVGVAALSLFCVLLALLGVFWIWLGFGFIGFGLACALRYGLDRTVEQERRPVIDASERLLRRLRMQGLDEEGVRQFVAKFAGRNWEEYFEELFGYEAKIAARGLLLRGGSAGVRERHAAWREPLVAVMERVEKARREARERSLLQAVERANLLAAGASVSTVEDRARAAADALVDAAGRVREAEQQHAPGDAGPTPAAEVDPPSERRPLGVWGVLAALFVGPHVRAAAGAVLLAGCAVWAYQNGLVPVPEAGEQTAGDSPAAATRPLAVDGVPPAATAWIDGWNAGFAGLLLLASLFFRGNLMAAFVLIGAAVAAVGHQHGIRTVESLRAEHVALVLGGVLALVGFRAAR